MFPLGIPDRVMVVPTIAFPGPIICAISGIFYITLLGCVIVTSEVIAYTAMLLFGINLYLTSPTTFDVIFGIHTNAPERVFQVIRVNLTHACIEFFWIIRNRACKGLWLTTFVNIYVGTFALGVIFSVQSTYIDSLLCHQILILDF